MADQPQSVKPLNPHPLIPDDDLLHTMRTLTDLKPYQIFLFVTLTGFLAVLAAPLWSANAQPESYHAPYPPPRPWYLPIVSVAESPSPTPTPEPTPTVPPTWTGPEGGSIVCLASDPHDPKVVYAGAWGGGVFRSLDQGQTWTWASQGLGNYYIDSLAVDPSDGDILYAGTHGGGIYKSTNGGQSWQFSGQTMQPGAVVYTIAIHPTNPQVLLAGTRKQGTGMAGPYSGVLYRSQDGAATWQAVLENVGGPGVQDWIYSIAINPSQPDLVLAAAHLNGAFFSTTGGQAGSWSPAAQRDGYDDFTKGRAVAFDPRSSSDAAFYATWHGGFYKSEDHGASFKLTDSSLDQIKIYPNGIAISATDPDWMYMASMDTASGVLRSTNGGATWGSVGLKDHNIYSVLAPGESVVFAGTVQDALFKSTNNGATWAHATDGMVIPQVTGLVEWGGDLYVSTRGAGIHRSTDNGQTWKAFNLGLTEFDVIALAELQGVPPGLTAITATGNSWQTSLDGSGWSPRGTLAANPHAPTGISAPDDPRWPREPAIDLLHLKAAGETGAFQPGQASLISMRNQAGSPLLWVGTPAGLFGWSTRAEMARPGLVIAQAVLALAADPYQPGTLAAAGAQGQLWITQDYGQHWRLQPGPGPEVISLAAVAGGLYAGTNDGLWHWNGSIWQRYGLGGRQVVTLAAQHTAPARLVAGVIGQTYTMLIPENTSAASPGWEILPELDGYTISYVSFTKTHPGDVFFAVFGRGVLRLSIGR